MDWKQIPAAPAYEINRRGQVRKRDTHYRITARRHRVRLWLGSGYLTVNPRMLAAELFTAPETIETAVAEPEPLDTTPSDTESVEPGLHTPDEPEPQAEQEETAKPHTARGRTWRTCVGVPGYEINRRGDVRTVNTCRVLPQYYSGDQSVPYVRLGVRGNITTRKIHLLLEETFGPGAAAAAGYPTPDLAQVRALRDAIQRRGLPRGSRTCHDCGTPTDNYRCNACWRRVRGYGVDEPAEEVSDAHDVL
ncbi:hypothetical protein DA2_3780 [Desulfovibrio sp. A2]|nr:hypothetical protein DA2_3780 [Desulfovibrio sp. A2]